LYITANSTTVVEGFSIKTDVEPELFRTIGNVAESTRDTTNLFAGVFDPLFGIFGLLDPVGFAFELRNCFLERLVD
jgi:hypothetical protein